MKFFVDVTQRVEVTLDESKFTPEFLADYQRMINSRIKTVDDHARYLGELCARGVITTTVKEVEGYGFLYAMGVKLSINRGCTEVESRSA